MSTTSGRKFAVDVMRRAGSDSRNRHTGADGDNLSNTHTYFFILRTLCFMHVLMWWMNYYHCTVNVFFFCWNLVGTSEWEVRFWRAVREGNNFDFRMWRGNDRRPRSKNYICFYFVKVCTFFYMMNLCLEVSIPLRGTIVGNALRGSTQPSYTI